MTKPFMVIYILILSLVFLQVLAQASGPVLPDKYRLPTDNELAAEWRSKDADRYATIAADFNGDGLVDGCFLAIDKKQNKLVLLVVLFDKGGSSERWQMLDTMNYDAIQYMGVEVIKPSTVMVYPHRGDYQKISKKVKNYSIKFFASEGSSSIFYWNKQTKRFQRLWLTK